MNGTFDSSARRLPGYIQLWVVGCALLMGSCATQENASKNTEKAPATNTVAPAPAVAPPPAPIVALPPEEAVIKAARDLFGKAALPAGQKYSVVIDPLVDGVTGVQSVATQAVEKRVTSLVKSDFPQYEIKPFNSTTVAALPLVFVGTFTPINLQGKAEGERDAYRVCFALADLKSGKIVSKGFARSQPTGLDPTPTPYFRDAPLWVPDKSVEGYIKVCQGTKAGDPINAAYLDTVVAAATIDEARRAYDEKNYRDALALYNAVLRNPAGDQPRVHLGMYLTDVKLGDKKAAMKAFGNVVKYGLMQKRLAVKFYFPTGSTSFGVKGQYERWLKEIASQITRMGTCAEVAGHASRGGPDELNERLSVQRAEFVRQRLIGFRQGLASHLSAQGYGARESMVGTARNDASDALDRRTEFKAMPCLT